MAEPRDEQEVLASLPPPPSAFPDFPAAGEASAVPPTAPETTSDDAAAARTSSKGSNLHIPTSAAKASSAARSMAAAARSKLTKGSRKVLSPLSHTISGKKEASPSSTSEETPTGEGGDPLGSLTSSLVSASSSFGSLLFSQSSSVDEAPGDEVDEEIQRQVSAQQRMKVLEDLVQHRRSDWNYLKAMHEGSNYWLNVALLREQQVMGHLGAKQSIRRGAQFFYLGIGLGRLVGESLHPELLAMDCCQLLEELEFFFSSATVQGMKMMVATSSTLHEPLDKEHGTQYSADEPFRPTLHKWNQRPVYRRLMTQPIPFPLDYREVLLSLCDILALIYSKLIEDSSCSENLNLFQAIIRFDDRIKKLFIDPVKKEFSAVASHVIAEEMRLVRKTYASGVRDSGNDGTLDVASNSGDARQEAAESHNATA